MSRLTPHWKWLAVLAIAVVVRCVVLLHLGSQLDVDRDLYRGIAQHVAAGDGFLHPDSGQASAYRPPLYPLILATVVRYGRYGIGALHLLIGTLTVVLTMLCAKKLKLASLNLVAGLCVALDPLLLQGTVQVMTETLAAALAIALLLVMHPDVNRSTTRTTLRGGLLGLCCLCRPTFWAFALLWSLVDLVSLWRLRVPPPMALDGLSANAGWPQQVALAACSPVPVTIHSAGAGAFRIRAWRLVLSFAAFLAVQAPWIIRNQHVLGSPVLTTTHGGYTLLLGHNAVYYRDVVARRWGTVWVGESLADWQAELERELSQQSPPLDFRPGQVDEIARDRWMSKRAWEVICSDPGMAVRSGLTLLGRFWNVAPQDTGEQSRLVRWCVGAWYAVLFITAVVGLTRVMRSRDCAWLPLILLLVGFTLVHTLYWSDMRMRAPLSPALALLAAAAFWRRETTALLTLRVIRPAAPDAR